MTNRVKLSWARILAEGSAIIVSILLAFGIQAWWEERLERVAEAELLSRLHAEFLANIARIDERTWYQTVLLRGEELFAQIKEARKDDEQTIMASGSTLRWFAYAPTFEADTPILDGLINGGQLQIIEDRNVQSVLATWERELRDYTAFAERARRYSDDFLLPALYRRGDVGDILMLAWSNHSPNDPGLEIRVQIRVDDELKGIVAGRYAAGRSAQGKFKTLRSAAIEVVDAIEPHLP
jgi:hypothetical protein